MGRNVFISFLGEGFYKVTKYNNDKSDLNETRFIQAATLEAIGASAWSEDSIIYVLLTDVARKNNWEDRTERVCLGKLEPYNGLHSELISMNLPCRISPIDIPDGNNIKEMFEIFMTLFEHINDGDILHLDMTHGFRYLPMFLLVLHNYTRFLKDVKISHMSYGNVFTPTKDIMDLLPLCTLQDWTLGAADFKKNGNVEDLVSLSNNEMLPILKEAKGSNENASNIQRFTKELNKVINEIKLCRGKEVIEAKGFKRLRDYASKIDMSENLQAFEPIQVSILNSLKDFSSEESIFNGFIAAKWCLDRSLYQQCISYIEETTISFICKKYNVPLYNENKRTIVSSCFSHIEKRTPENKWNLGNDPNEYSYNLELSRIIVSEIDEKFAHKFCVMSGLRNDINHVGMRQNSRAYDKLLKDIEVSLDYFLNYFIDEKVY